MRLEVAPRPSRGMLVRAAYLLAAVVVAAGGVLYAMSQQGVPYKTPDEWPRVYDRVGTAKVTVNDQLSPESHLYRASDGRMVVDLNHGENVGMYMLFPERLIPPQVDTCYYPSFRVVDGKLRCSEFPPQCKPLDKVIAEEVSRLVVRGNTLEFNVSNKRRISVTW